MAINIYSLLSIIVIGGTVLTIITYYCSLSSLNTRSSQVWRESIKKRQPLFQCRSIGKVTHLKLFFEVDCTNPFLKALVEDIENSVNYDICDSFSPLYDRITTEFRSFKTFKFIDFERLLKACPACHHLQVINGELYVVPRSTSTNYETRSRSIKTLFKYVIDTFSSIPNLEFLVNVGDAVGMDRNVNHPLKCPVFGFAKNKNDMINGTYTDGVVSIPCYSFWSWPQPKITRWDKKIISIKQAGDHKAYTNRTSKLFWRGARTGRRHNLVSIAQKYPQVMDVSFMHWIGAKHLTLSTSNEYQTLEQHCAYKSLLHLEGNTYSARLKYLLLCGSPVVFVAISGWEEFWYPLLKHQENIIILDKVDETLLLNLTNYLLENTRTALRIGINGQNIVLKYLNEQAIFCYMRNVLLAYSKLVDYQVTKHDQALPIDDFLVSYLTK